MKYSYTLLGLASIASGQQFTSIYNITATPGEVISNAGVPTPGAPGAKGQFNYAIDSKSNTICYDITLEGVVGDYQSPARTATHIHEGVKGSAGPPRIALPNPIGDDNYRNVKGCLTGPFTTGLNGTGGVTDTGAGFQVSQIEANPAGFFTDSHTVLFPAGVVRGQLDYKFEIIKPNPGYPENPYPQDPTTTKKDDGPGTTKMPETTKYPETSKKDDGHEITTYTYTKTHEITISKCKDEVTDCPYKTKPVVTKTEDVYTTVCPKSEVTDYPKTNKTAKYDYPQTDKHDYETKTKVYTYSANSAKTVYETVSKSDNKYETKTIKTEYPVVSTKTEYETVSKPVYSTKSEEGKPSEPVVTYPADKPTYHATSTGAVHPTPTTTITPPPYFTGAASSNKVGGLLVAAGVVAAFL